VDKLWDILRHFLLLGERGFLSMLDYSPLLHEWLHAASAEPLTFLTDWHAFADIKGSYVLSTQYQSWQEDYDPEPFLEQQFAFLLQQQMRSLAWNIHLDWARAGPAGNPKDINTKRFERWLLLAYTPAFSLVSTPLGHAPLQHTGELPFLRPLLKKSMNTTFDLGKFMNTSLYLPLMATIFLPFPVDPYMKSDFKNVVLFTQSNADDAAAKAAQPADPVDDDDLPTTPGMMAFQSSAQRKQHKDTIYLDTSPVKPAAVVQRKMPPPYSVAQGQQLPPQTPLQQPMQAYTARHRGGLPPTPKTYPNHPPQFEQPDFYTGRMALPMSPTRFTRQPMAHQNPRQDYNRQSAPATGDWRQNLPGNDHSLSQIRHNHGVPPYQPPSARESSTMFPMELSSLPRPRQDLHTSRAHRVIEPPPILGFHTATTAALASSTSTDPSTWLLLAPDTRHPAGHWFFSALMSYEFDGFSGYFAGSDRQVGHICNVFVPLWTTFQLRCLAPARAIDGK
jgi:hypothetical protein